jgi:TolB-like protein/DNA-binding winged helix-turn-helix (wHTH) protein/Tfp pilus assembly protein PilF
VVVSENGARLVQFGIFEVDLRAGELHRNGSKVKLQEQPFQVLDLLLQHPGEVVTREELQRKLWPADTFVDFDHGLNAAVRRLRDALGDSAENPRFVETVARRGYRFLPPVKGEVASIAPALPSASRPKWWRILAAVLVPSESQARSIASFRDRRLWLFVAGAVCLVGIAFWGWWRSQNRRPVPVVWTVRSLAVLPLKNLSGDPLQEYLADGMTEELIGRLSMIHGLRVISRTSAMHFKNTQLSMPEIAKALGVDAIVEGSVMREGGRIRVHAKLIRGASDEHFWSETYDRELGDALPLQGELAQAIAGRVEVTVTGVERTRLVAARKVSPEVYESFLKGQSESYSGVGVERAIDYFEEAIKKDRTFAPAYVGLAAAYGALGTPGIGVAPPGEVLPKALSAARKALELDPALPDAHALLGSVYQAQWKWSDAEREYKLALELNPNSARAQVAFAEWLLSQGHTEEAQAWSRRAREVNPFGDNGSIGWILFHSRQYDEAIRELRSAVALHPDDASTYWFLGFALIANGEPDKAIPVLEKGLALSNRSPGVIGVLIRAYAHAGRRTKALHLLNELKRRQQTGYVPAAAFVNAYLGLGDNEQAIAWLERAYQEESMILQFLKVHPFFDPLRGHPRFADLVRRVGLDQAR